MDPLRGGKITKKQATKNKEKNRSERRQRSEAGLLCGQVPCPESGGARNFNSKIFRVL